MLIRTLYKCFPIIFLNIIIVKKLVFDKITAIDHFIFDVKFKYYLDSWLIYVELLYLHCNVSHISTQHLRCIYVNGYTWNYLLFSLVYRNRNKLVLITSQFVGFKLINYVIHWWWYSLDICISICVWKHHGCSTGIKYRN